MDELNALFKLPKGLAAMGVDAARVDELTAMALEDPSVGGNPVADDRTKIPRALFLAAM